MKIGFIGLGNMGSAVAQAVAKLGTHKLLYSDHNRQKASQLASMYPGEILPNQEIVNQADLVFLGVKPHLLTPLMAELGKGERDLSSVIWVSMAAGIGLSDLEALGEGWSFIHMMPNTPVVIGQGMTSFTTNNPDLIPLFEELMAKSGQVRYLDEKQMDAATAIAGCGPAFVYEFIEALTSAGIQSGLSAQLAQDLASQTLIGAATLLRESGDHPAVLRDQVTSPGGSTIAGLVAMTEAGFQAATIQGVNQALKRTKELGKKERNLE